jgi:hypothetical protein
MVHDFRWSVECPLAFAECLLAITKPSIQSFSRSPEKRFDMWVALQWWPEKWRATRKNTGKTGHELWGHMKAKRRKKRGFAPFLVSNQERVDMAERNLGKMGQT